MPICAARSFSTAGEQRRHHCLYEVSAGLTTRQGKPKNGGDFASRCATARRIPLKTSRGVEWPPPERKVCTCRCRSWAWRPTEGAFRSASAFARTSCRSDRRLRPSAAISEKSRAEIQAVCRAEHGNKQAGRGHRNQCLEGFDFGGRKLT
jgi:hypothetical protein